MIAGKWLQVLQQVMQQILECLLVRSFVAQFVAATCVVTVHKTVMMILQKSDSLIVDSISQDNRLMQWQCDSS